MKILIYEDNQNDLNNLLQCIYNYFCKTELEYIVETTVNSKFIIDNHLNYDLIFLDVEVLGESGIEVGCKVRRKNHDVRIIFVTSYSKYLIDGYKAQANRYFVKPVQQEDFDIEINNVISDYLDDFSGFYDETLSVNKIYFNKILYLEYINRKTFIHFLSGEVITSNYPLKYWLEFLKNRDFAQPYKSIIVNLKQISGFTKAEIILNNEERLPISRFFKKNLEFEYVNCLHRRF